MTGSSKDHAGCWTCRLRRKKCDQAQPICRTCLALEINCYTDRHKPEWMENGSKQREMAQRFKVDVKRSAARRRSRRLMQRLAGEFDKEGEAQTPEPFPDTSLTPAPDSNIPKPNGVQHQRSVSPDNGVADIGAARAASEFSAANGFARISLDLSTRPDSHQLSQPIDNELEMQFVMIYLDYTFPILFPMYIPSLTEGGRGWLLVLPMKIKALYHTIISLTSYFFSSTPIGLGPAQDLCSSLAFGEQRKQIDLAVKMVSRDLEIINSQGVHSNLLESVYLFESIVQLLIFDGVVATTETWRIHLDAAIVLFEQIIQTSGSIFSVLDPMRQRSGLPANTPGDTFWSADQAAFRFYSSILVFADIISSTALEQPPKLQRYHANILTEKSDYDQKAPLQLEDFIGCQNEVLCSISKIATLDAWKKDMKKHRRLNMTQLMERASAIERDLATTISHPNAVSNINDASFPIAPHQQWQPNTPPFTPSHKSPTSTTKIITLIWAHAARIYLQIVLSGWQTASPEVRHDVTATLKLLTDLSHFSPGVLHALAWPFCVAGCLADSEEERAFRDIVDAMGPLGYLGSIKAAMGIMERVWARQDEIDGNYWDVAACLGSQGFKVLFI